MLLRDYIYDLLEDNRSDYAIEVLEALLEGKNDVEPKLKGVEMPNADELHYMLGNLHYKRGDWKKAIEHYLEACEINPESPANEKLKMTYSILEFYNKDVFGQ